MREIFRSCWVGQKGVVRLERKQFMSDFQGIGLVKPILRALKSAGYMHPTPIQDQAITPLMEHKDLLGIAQTGTGKTAAFALPTLHLLATGGKKALRREPRGLILAPTR